MLEVIVLAICVVVSFVTGVFAFTRNPKHIINRLYGILALTLTVWPIFNFLSLQTDERLFYIRIVIFLVTIMNGALFYLVLAMYRSHLKFSRLEKFGIYFTILVAAACFTPLVFSGLTSGANPSPIPSYGVVLFLAHLLIFLGGSLVILFRRVRQLQGLKRYQALYVLIGITPLSIFAPVTGFVLPVVFQNVSLVVLSPVYAAFFVVLVGYSIVKHRLFDIRPVVARSVAYALSILFIGLVYGFFVFGFIDGFFPETRMSILQQSIYTLAAVFLVLTFQPIKRFFDQLTDRIFYRDRYDTEDVLNRLGKIFVAKSNSFELLDDSLKVISDTLKIEFSRLAVLDNGQIYKTAHTGAHQDISLDIKDLNKFEKRINILDELNDEERSEILRGAHAYALIRLETQDSLIGYLVLGAKQSGTIFTQQDVNFLEILSQELAVAIQNAKSYEEIQAFSETLKKEVRDATAKLRETNKRLRKLDEAKDEFISMASHQLRTPLTTIKGYLSMLLEGDAGKLPNKSKEFIDLAFVSSERMVHLIADMLNVSRISTGRLTIDENEIDLVEVVEGELEQLRRQADTKDVDLNLHKPDKNLPKLKLDENKIRQVIMNFSDNAIYYTPEGKVDVYIVENDGFVEFRVEDNGIGVSKEAQKQLFNKFFRAENARQVRPDGTGLGLYMAKQVIEAQDGEIIFSSKKGKGSTFGFRFKLKDKAAK